MAKKLFIGSFPLTTTEQIIKDLFNPHGQVISVSIISDINTGLSRGFGFVEMATDEAATTVIEKMNGYLIGDRKIVVKEALAKTSYTGMNDNQNMRNRRFKRF